MPRAFSTAILGELNKRLGTEPLVIVEVEWVDGAPVAYTDRKLNGEEYPYPFLVRIDRFDATTLVTGETTDQNTSVTLSDVDGSIKAMIDQHDIHLNTVRVYIGFQGLPYTEKALMFEGVINSPIVWDEGSRTLTFDVFSKLEDSQAGFTMDDGDFPYIPPDERNKPWPLVFGQVCNMEAVRVTTLRKGFLGEGQGVMDPTIEERLCQANKLKCPTKTVAATSKTPGGGLDVTGSENIRANKPDQSCVTRRFNEICNILREREQQSQYVKTQLTIRGGEQFPQNEKITILIGEVRFIGTMVGEEFTITQVFHPDLTNIQNPPCKDVKEAKVGFRYKPGAGQTPSTTLSCDQGGGAYDKDIVDGSGESWRYYQTFEKSRFIWLPPGTEVFLAEEAEIVNIVSLLPGTVDQVAAYRTFGDTTLLVEVPTDKYDVYTTDFGGYDVVEVRLHAPLSTIKDEDWEDEIYVSFTSSIGPNPVDIIEWLVEKYTDYTVDAANFASIHAKLVNYPCNFFVKSRPSVFKLIRDIAFQSRMSVTIRQGIVSLVYLSEEPTSLKTITVSDILPNSFQISHTQTEDLVTRHEITWKNGDAGVFSTDETEFNFVLKHNVPKYGTITKEYDYYTYNLYELAEKSATFWMIRNANTWKYIEFQTPLKHLDLDVYDCFTINIPQFPTTKCVVTETICNPDDNTIKFKAWTPVLAGSTEPYYWAWPAYQDANAVFPLVDSQEQEGDGYGFTVIPPPTHPLYAGYDPETARLATNGDRHPSDLDDTFPQVECTIATGAEIAPDLEPVFTPDEPVANESFADNLDNTESGGTSASDDKEEKTACGDPGPDGAGCQYEVVVTYVTPLGIAPYRADVNDFAGPCTGQTGRPCFGPQHQMCHIFGALFAATAFASQKKAEAQALWDNGGYTKGKSDVLTVGPVNGIPGEGYAGECESTGGGNQGDPAAPGAGAGEVTEPGCKESDLPNCGCGTNSKRNSAGVCVENPPDCEARGNPCPPGHSRQGNQCDCLPDETNCPEGTHLNPYGVCVEGEDED